MHTIISCACPLCFSENIASDCFHGCFVVTCTLCAFISLVWLREQILHGGGPDWLEQDIQGGHARVSNLHCDVGPDKYKKRCKIVIMIIMVHPNFGVVNV